MLQGLAMACYLNDKTKQIQQNCVLDGNLNINV